MSARLVRAPFRAAALAAAALLAASPAAAQLRTGGSSVGLELTPYAGYMFFGDYLDGPFGTSVSNANGRVLGAQLGLRLTPNVAVVGNLARASADLEVGLPILGGVGVGSSQVWLYDAGLQFSAGTIGRQGAGISPFLQIGAGGARHELSSAGLETNASNFTFNAGLGADVMLARNLGLRLMAKDYIGRFDVEEASTVDAKSDLRHNVALSAGLKLAF
jgi:hypothetical protein